MPNSGRTLLGVFSSGSRTGSLDIWEPLVNNNGENNQLWTNAVTGYADFNRITAKVSETADNTGSGIGTMYDASYGIPGCAAYPGVVLTCANGRLT